MELLIVAVLAAGCALSFQAGGVVRLERPESAPELQAAERERERAVRARERAEREVEAAERAREMAVRDEARAAREVKAAERARRDQVRRILRFD